MKKKMSYNRPDERSRYPHNFTIFFFYNYFFRFYFKKFPQLRYNQARISKEIIIYLLFKFFSKHSTTKTILHRNCTQISWENIFQKLKKKNYYRMCSHGHHDSRRLLMRIDLCWSSKHPILNLKSIYLSRGLILLGSTAYIRLSSIAILMAKEFVAFMNFATETSSCSTNDSTKI